ncbi:sugar phosphate isomerase/epimerase family protein [Paenibacillus eucommiae]|uniref:Xylose isomerase n=1 Tax=Paenibacillus eucommiae TaxID=1355755 RepID=A0ABS4J1H8_9BACL|nr:sugar phosphate isomerase/epimerase family protein [Paenibacillus eucommiae]MBP1993681.1 xylose isomerase [Paenibacillus eucommiae]
MLKIDSGLTSFSTCNDRFVRNGYRDPLSLDEQLELAAQVPGLTGVAFDYPTQFEDPVQTKQKLASYGLVVGMVEIDMYSQAKWKYGSLTSADPRTRKEALELIKRGIDFAGVAEAADVQLWLGQDGYEYPFQSDYSMAWDQLAESLKEVAAYRPDVKITVEYKSKEPRARCFIANAGVALALVNDVGTPNIGVTLDVGHSLMAKENPAEAAVLLSKYKRLFHLHINDNYRDWDHDMVPGTVNFWDTLEFFYWLRKVGFDGWFGVDIYPYRENGLEALSQTVRYIHRFYEVAGTLDEHKLQELRAANEPLKIMDMMMERFLK